jgi:hypothetical protein
MDSAAVWFGAVLLGILLFYARRPSALTAGIVFSVVCTIVPACGRSARSGAGPIPLSP